MSLRRGQMISRKAWRRLFPVTLVGFAKSLQSRERGHSGVTDQSKWLRRACVPSFCKTISPSSYVASPCAIT